MTKVYLENRGRSLSADSKLVESSKFFEIVDDGANVITRWGPTGAKGQTKTICSDALDKARQSAFNKKLNEKLGRGYVVISDANGVQEDRPSDSGRFFGLEVETHSNLDVNDVANLMKNRGLNVSVKANQYFQSNGATWDVKRDGSCGYEFASPKLKGEAGIFDAKLAVEKIREVCPTAVNQKCGIHVTIDVSDHSPADLKRLVVGYLKAQEHLYGQCAAWRQDNHYCKRNPTHRLSNIIAEKTIELALDMAGGWRNHQDRYHGLNLTRVFSKKVVEFRMMESSVSIRKVGAWIRTCVGLVDGLKKSNVTFKTGEPFSAETFEAVVNGRWKV
jgi:predicted DNA-binding WGR domain protein